MDIPFEDNPELMAQFRRLLHLPSDAELDAGQVVRAVELAQAEIAVLDATAAVLDRSFVALMDEHGVGFDDGPGG
jgi:hypothetical protein